MAGAQHRLTFTAGLVEVIKQQRTRNEGASADGVQPGQRASWQHRALTGQGQVLRAASWPRPAAPSSAPPATATNASGGTSPRTIGRRPWSTPAGDANVRDWGEPVEPGDCVRPAGHSGVRLQGSGEALAIWVELVGGAASGLPQTESRRHPIRVSLGGSLASVARFRFAGRCSAYAAPVVPVKEGTAAPLTIMSLGAGRTPTWLRRELKRHTPWPCAHRARPPRTSRARSSSDVHSDVPS